MSNSVLLLMFGITSALMLAYPVNMMPVQSESSNSTTTTPNHEQHFSLSQYTAMLRQIIAAMQTIQTLVDKHERPKAFEHCFVKSIPSTNLTIEDRLFIDYQVIEELTAPLRDLVNYEAHINNNSDIYQKLVWAQGQLNASLEEIESIRHSDQLMEQLSHRGLPTEGHQHSLEYDNSSSNDTTSGDRCMGVITNSTDELRDLYEIQLGLDFAFSDLLDIRHELSPN